MSALDFTPEFRLTSGVFRTTSVQKLYGDLKSNSTVFQTILKDIPAQFEPFYGGGRLTGIVITDDWRQLGVSEKPAVPAAANERGGKIVVYLNPDVIGSNGLRSLTVAEMLVHELSDMSKRGQQLAAAAIDSEVARAELNQRGFAAEKAYSEEQGLSYPATPNNTYATRPAAQVVDLGAPKLVRCFVAGTLIDMADGTRKPIERIAVGDMVMAFDPHAEQGLGPAVPRRVTRTFRNTARVLLDVAGLRVTPGHEVLSDGGEWMSVAEVLRRDRALVLDVAGPGGERHGALFRARTGARLGGLADIVFETRFRDPHTGAVRTAAVRGGIPFAVVGFEDGAGDVEARLLPLFQALHLDGGYDVARTLASGAPRDAWGRPPGPVDWPEGRTPFDHAGSENHVVAVDGRPYAPDWIAATPREGKEKKIPTPMSEIAVLRVGLAG